MNPTPRPRDRLAVPERPRLDETTICQHKNCGKRLNEHGRMGQRCPTTTHYQRFKGLIERIT